MKKIISMLLISVFTVLGLVGCGEESSNNETVSTTEISESETSTGMLVIYFSATGTTKGIAEKIASVTGADLVRPEYEDIQVDIENDYSTIFIGYPIWWGQEPRIMDTFVESYNFEGKTIIPFCTSGSSGIESSSTNLVEKAGTGNWLSGNRFSGSATEDEIKNWISGLEID